MDRIDAMQAFVAVADLQGFAPAARKLGLSPSGVTRLIAALEDRLGARLLQRTTRSVALTDVGARYLERARRILADVEEAEGSAEGERTRPSGRLVVSAPVGFGRLHVSPVMSAYLKRYPEVSGELRLSDRMINLVEDGVDLAVRIGHLADSSLVARHVGEMRRIVVASPGYLKAHGEPKTPEAIASHQTIQFGATTAPPDWRFVGDGREVRVAPTPRFTTNSADAAIQYAEQGGGLTRVLAYQAADAIKAGRLKIVLAKFEQPAAADPHRLSDLAAVVGQGAHLHRSRDRDQRLAFWRLICHSGAMRASNPESRGSAVRVHAPRNDIVLFRHHAERPLARAITASSALTRHCAKQSVLPVLITSLSTASHCPIWAVPMKSIAHARPSPANERRPSCGAQLWPIALSVSAAISPPWTKPARVGVRRGQPKSEDHRLWRFASNRSAPRDR